MEKINLKLETIASVFRGMIIRVRYVLAAKPRQLVELPPHSFRRYTSVGHIVIAQTIPPPTQSAIITKLNAEFLLLQSRIYHQYLHSSFTYCWKMKFSFFTWRFEVLVCLFPAFSAPTCTAQRS